MLAAVPVGESPTGGECPDTTVVISGNGEGDRAVESPEVNVSGAGVTWSDPPRRLATRQAVADANQCSPEISPHRKRMVGFVGSAEPIATWRRPLLSVKNWVSITDELSGVVEDGMPRKERAAKARNHLWT